MFILGLPSVITLCVPAEGGMADGLSVSEACQKLEQAGADVVGLNCSRGPVTMLPLLKEVRKVCKVSIQKLRLHIEITKCCCTA